MSIGLETGPVNARMAALFGELGDGTAPSLAERVRAQRVHSVLFGTQVSTPRLGRFVVLRELGRGGMGTVYAAHDTQLDRQVAVKLLHRVSTRSRARLLREAQSMARLGHPNVVPVFELSLDSPRPFVVMQLVEGQTLGQWLRARRRDASAILSMFRQAGAGLVAAHALGMVHRDFKPS
ncbi:MAG: serine/threonine protein kinase, partial [Deltaproteobacteria bacterium]|nr:serine/threonine protein kinase [Deltaproteobacteria bacterium]